MGVFETLKNKVTTAQKKISDAQKKREIKQLKKRKRQFKRDEIELMELKQKAKIEKQKASIRKSRKSGLSTGRRRRKINTRSALGMTRPPKAVDGKKSSSKSFNPITGNSSSKKKKLEKDSFGGVRPPGFF